MDGEEMFIKARTAQKLLMLQLPGRYMLWLTSSHWFTSAPRSRKRVTRATVGGHDRNAVFWSYKTKNMKRVDSRIQTPRHLCLYARIIQTRGYPIRDTSLARTYLSPHVHICPMFQKCGDNFYTTPLTSHHKHSISGLNISQGMYIE